MARSPAHKFGQIIGDLLEDAFEPLLQDFARQHHLYLDRKGNRPARPGKKVCWTDAHGNTHDLDYVLERGGTDTTIGVPVAFIESAWRRYTKHSRNKAQEIQGAVLPLAETYRDAAPFIGAVLAGVFTEGALEQMKSLGFHVLYFPYDTVVKAFQTVGIDARYEETTPDAEVRRKTRAWEHLAPHQQRDAAEKLIELNSREVQSFVQTLAQAIARRIASIRICPLHGDVIELSSIQQAVKFIDSYDENAGPSPFARYEIQVRYTNADRVEGTFADKHSAVEFLQMLQRRACTTSTS